MADRQLVGLPGALELLKSAAEGVVLALGASGLTAILTRAAEIATDFARAISEAPEWVQRLISGALLLGPALLGIAAAAKGLSFVLGGLQILMGPAGLIIAGIAALVLGAVLLIKHWDKVSALRTQSGRSRLPRGRASWSEHPVHRHTGLIALGHHRGVLRKDVGGGRRRTETSTRSRAPSVASSKWSGRYSGASSACSTWAAR